MNNNHKKWKLEARLSWKYVGPMVEKECPSCSGMGQYRNGGSESSWERCPSCHGIGKHHVRANSCETTPQVPKDLMIEIQDLIERFEVKCGTDNQ